MRTPKDGIKRPYVISFKLSELKAFAAWNFFLLLQKMPMKVIQTERTAWEFEIKTKDCIFCGDL